MDRWTTADRNFRTFLLVSQLDPDAIRARIREARKAASLTQQELADLIERHKRTVENYENTRVPEWSELTKIARVLDRPIEWFLYGDREEETAAVDAVRELREELRRRHQDVVERLEAIAEHQRELARRLPTDVTR